MRITYSKPDMANVLEFDLRYIDRDSIKAVVEELRDAASDPAALLRNESGRNVHHIKATCRLPNGKPMSEKELWERAADFDDLHPVALEYARRLGAGVKGLWIAGSDTRDPLWHDEWHPAGCYAIAPLTFKSTRYLDALIDLAKGSDLDHADIYTPWIHLVLRHHGWSGATKRLLAYRCGVLRGEAGGLGNLGMAVHDLGFRDWLVERNELETFGDEVLESLGGDDEWGYAEDARSALFVGNDAGYLEALSRARERSADMLERFPDKLHYERFRYAQVPWDDVPKPGGR